jgi:uncharacterized protein
MVAELNEVVPMPAPPSDLLRVNKFYPFEEAGRRLMLVVENAAFAEADDAGWALAQMVAGKERVRRSEVLAALTAAFGEEEAAGALSAFEQLEILSPFARPRMAPDAHPVVMMPLSSLVLHVAHDCNLRCGYCYADFGRYGGDFGVMTEEMALEHCRRFFDQLGDSKNLHVTFFGGEPLMNLPVVFAAHRYVKERAAKEGRRIAYGLTTNGTLLTDALVEFFAAEGFTITISMDGPPDVHDRLRPLQEGGGSYERIMERVRATGIKAIARVTLTRRSTGVARIVRHLVQAGFREVGVSPVATGSDKFDLSDADLVKVLEGMRVLCDDFVEWAKQGKVFPYSNVRALLEQIASGDPRAVPCGAGTKLVAADNKGDLYACHRLVGEAAFKIGDVKNGIDGPARFALVTDMHPRGRAPCNECWARYLCGGGCHHIAWLHSEKAQAPWTISDGFCDFLRAWYRLGLYTYARMTEEAPEVLARLRGEKTPCSQASGM